MRGKILLVLWLALSVLALITLVGAIASHNILESLFWMVVFGFAVYSVKEAL